MKSKPSNKSPQIIQLRWGTLLLRLAALTTLSLICGCQTTEKERTSNLDLKILIGLIGGIPQSKLESVLGVPAHHEFTVLGDSITNRCVSYYFAAYYLVVLFRLHQRCIDEDHPPASVRA